ncbi:MAG: DUF350 domain-containing protein [Cardiobacteriaceae bacterium]|nr:DUF350 domain-containing protein [Cardiobacteriaceae bacterium]
MIISLAQYGLYLQYMVLGAAMLFLFSVIYLRITPAAELKLAKQGNLACALSFGGAMIGFSLAISSSIAQSVHLLDFFLWGLAAGVIQILVYFAATRFIPKANEELVANNVAVGAWLAAVSVSIGLLNAACLT